MVIEAENLCKAYGDQADWRTSISAFRPAGSSASSAPMAPARRRCSGCSWARKTRRGRTAGRCTVELGYVDQSRDDLGAEHTVLPGNLRRPRNAGDGRPQDQRPRLRLAIQFPRSRPAKKSRACCPAVSGTGFTWPSCYGVARTYCCWTNRPTTWTSTRLRALEEAIANYAGCAVVISHDRWFLDRLATHILAFEGDGYVHWCEGNFQTYEQQRRERLGIKADEPHRFRYKKLQQH